MFKSLLVLSFLFLGRLDPDVKVATWSIGKPDAPSYESLSFWIKDDHRAYVRYAHGMSEGDTELQWMGPGDATGSFRVSMPKSGTCCWVIAPDSVGIRVSDRRRTRTFYWEDANPSSDSTNDCAICARSEKQAQSWLRRYFLH